MKIQETSFIYKSANGIDLKLHLFLPEGIVQRAALLFFHGGRFVQGHPAQFFPHCRYLATRGMVTASATYRLLGKGADSVLDCFEDSRAAIRWLRSHAAEWAIDPTQVVVAGGSAGANLAANAALRDSDAGDGAISAVSSRPDALILFSPAVVRPLAVHDLIDEELYAQLRPRAQLPPMLLFHGVEDEIFSLTKLQDFCAQMQAAGNLCRLCLDPQGRHGFFNYGRDENRPFYTTMIESEEFLSQLGMLPGSSTLSFARLESLRHDGDWQA